MLRFLLVLSMLFTTPVAQAEAIRLVAFGDSLSAGYQLPPGADFAAKLEAALVARGHVATVVNAGVSGDTASAGLARLDWAIGNDVDGVILELGANDALRGIDPAITANALADIIARLNERGIAVLLAGMLAPPNLGEDFGTAFDRIFPMLAKSHDLVFYPFFLDGVITEPSLLLADGMHPNTRGVDAIVRAILPSVETLITRIESAN